MVDDSVWADLSEHELERWLGVDTLRRGIAYSDQGRVGRIDVGGTAERRVATASVRGTSFRAYVTVVTLSYADHEVRLETRCSCPVHTRCKHAAAVVWTLGRRVRHERTPAWQLALQPVTLDANAATGSPLALEFERVGQDLTLRPLMWGKSGKWIRSGVTWDRLTSDFGGVYRVEHRDALQALRGCTDGSSFSYYSRPNELSMQQTRRTVWAALRDVRDAGVPMLRAGTHASVHLLDAPAHVTTQVRPASDGIELRTGIVWPTLDDGDPPGGLGESFVLGSPGHGVWSDGDDGLFLAPFIRPVTSRQQALLRPPGVIRVPEADVATFALNYLPALRRNVELHVDESLDLPEVAAPVAHLQVTPHRDQRVSLQWSVRYDAGDHHITVPPLPRREDPPMRDSDAELALWASLPSGPWPVTTIAGGRRPAENALLNGRDTIDFVSHVLPQLQADDRIDVTVVGDLPTYREAEAAPVVELRVKQRDDGGTDWFNLAVDVTIDGETVPFTDLFVALSNHDDHLVLDSGTWFSLDRPELRQLRDLIAEASELSEGPEGELQLRPVQAGLWDELVKLGVVAEQAGAWQRAVSGLLDLTQLPDAAPPAGLQATLRPYQNEGYRWLSFLWSSRLGGILADDMGLGKTLQTLALVASLKERGELQHPVLVVAPTSVLGTWQSEAARFTPALRVAVVEQTAAKRGASLAEVAADADVIVTSYTLLRLGDTEYGSLRWSVVVLDEAQFVKNRQAKAYQAVRKLPADLKLAITGTPLENNLMDLWSLLSITCPGLFPHPERFSDLYRRPIESGSDADALPRLRRRIRPVLLRRTKEAVASELPPKQEQVLAVELSPAHRRLYDRQLQAERKKVLGLVGDVNRNRIAILRSLTLLRQLSLSPVLADASHPAQSAKIDTLVEMLTEVASEGHRALVFSQFTSFLALVQARLRAEGIGFQYLDGRTRDRAARVAAFRGGDDPAVLISLKAGGFGLTLTEADYVFVLDPWWNPAAELQAIDRTHRIGQDKHVMVYRLVSADTIEEKVVALQQRKRDLFTKVVGSGDEMAAPLSADDIRGLLDL